MSFGQVITAMVTPFENDDSSKISTKSIIELTSFLDKNGTDAFVLSGTTGEGPTLSNEERLLLFNTVRFTTKKPIIANLGTNNTAETIENINFFEKNAQIDGLLVVCPYYNKPNQEGLFMHFSEIAKSTSLPIIIYNIPGRTGVKMEPSTVARLAKIKNIFGIKESTGDMQSFTEICLLTKDDNFHVYSGDDYMTLPALSVGAEGVVSVASHVVGNDMQDMINHFKSGDVSVASAINQKLFPFFNGIFYKTNPIPIKEILNKLNISVGSTRLPIYSETTKADESFLDSLLSSQILLPKK